MKPRQQPHLTPQDAARLARVSMLLDGRTRVLRAGPGLVEAVCHLLDGGTLLLGYRDGAWWCDCCSDRSPCGHVRALQLVTQPEPPVSRGLHIPSAPDRSRSETRCQVDARESQG